MSNTGHLHIPVLTAAGAPPVTGQACLRDHPRTERTGLTHFLEVEPKPREMK